jgi:spore coat protein U domain-containing protein, fimbrial subunit CupE1/2/3/6
MKLRTLAMLVAGVVLISLSAFAADATGNLSVSANVVNACTVSDGTLNFGAYDPLSGSNLDQTGSFDVRCTNGGSAAIKLDQGLHGTGSLDAPARRMTDGGGNYLDYQLFSDVDRAVAWEGATGIDYTGTGNTQSQTVYGRIVAGQNAVAGNFSDTVVITVTY